MEKNLGKILNLNREPLEHLIHKCSQIKAGIVKRDESDTRGIRAILNYGHTVGHAVETAGKYSKLYTHGEAVAFGMVVAADIAARMRLLKEKDRARIEALIKKTGLPTRIRRLKLKDIMEAQSYDKKIIHGVNRFVLPVKIGRVEIHEDIPKKLIANTIRARRD